MVVKTCMEVLKSQRPECPPPHLWFQDSLMRGSAPGISLTCRQGAEIQ